MRILGIDTATASTAVAVTDAQGRVMSEVSHRDPRRHAEVLPALVREVLAASDTTPADLDLIAVGVGPGPFTGLRVGVSFARAMAHALDVPVVGAMTLDVIARAQAGQPDRGGFADPPGADGMTVVTRSRRVEVAWATYDAEGQRLEGPLVLPDSDYPRVGRVVGDVDGVDVSAYPSAAILCELVHAQLAAGEPLPADRSWPEDAAAGTGGPTATALSEMAAAGLVLLPALPLYLRRPDAVPA
ncbi:MAG: tRNA (adenosine(37)-N6)-threonylcarbamoyltransferase complex dimerization subunit type 1 TsaB [Candidatus Nanopelagicales bacterium]